MSKINETLVMMAEQAEVFKIGDRNFQIIEVKEAEQQPDYSHFMGKFVKCKKPKTDDSLYVLGKWYPIVYDLDYGFGIAYNNNGNYCTHDSGNNGREGFLSCFDLYNPSDTNPDEKKRILVPKEVKVYDWSDGLMAIGFGSNQVLCVLKNHESYTVSQAHSSYLIQCELVKCERAELKKGDLAFRSDEESTDFDDLSNYCVVINESEHAYVNEDKSIYYVEARWKHWYKLQPIN